MLHLDDAQLYDLSEAGPLLFKDPVRLTREARIRAIPSARVGPSLGLPTPWVDAEAGQSDADPISLATYWLGRLAPPSTGARKPVRSRAKLPSEALLSTEAAAAALFATVPALERLEREGRMPALRLDGAVHYDQVLVDLMAAEADDTAAAETRRVEVRAWARYEYRTVIEEPAPVAASPFAEPDPAQAAAAETPGLPPNEPMTPEGVTPEGVTPEAEGPEAEAPRAYEMPSDLLEIDGFETLDED